MTSLSLTKVFSPSYSPRKSSRSNLGKKMPAFTPSSPQSSPSPSSSSPPTKKQRPSRPKKKTTTSTKKKAKAVRKATVFASIMDPPTNPPMTPRRPRTVSFGGTVPDNVAPPRTVPTIVNPYKKTPHTVHTTVIPTVIPIVNDIRVSPEDTPPPATAPTTTNSPVDSTSDSSDFFLDLSGRPSLPPSETDDSDDEADEDDAEADGPPNLLPSQADDDDDEVAQPRPPPQRAAVMRNVALGKFFCVPTNST
jgi:hypothetical protein